MKRSFLWLAAVVALLAPATASAAPYRGMWLTQTEISAAPSTGTAINNIKTWADKTYVANGTGAINDRNLSNQDSLGDVITLAAALYYAKTGTSSYLTKVCDSLAAVQGTEDISGTRALATGRGIQAYVIAADLVNAHVNCITGAAAAGTFEPWLQSLYASPTSSGPASLVECHDERPNNWGNHCGASRIALDVYLGNSLTNAWNVFRGFAGNRAVYAGFNYGSTEWQANESAPVGINPAGATKVIGGVARNVDGVIPDDQRRCSNGTASWPPCYSNYTYETQQGLLVAAVLLERQGFAAFAEQSQAVCRAHAWMRNVQGTAPSGDDVWMSYVVNQGCGTSYSAAAGTQPGKGMGFTDWATPDLGGGGDTVAPSQPGNVRRTSSTQTSISFAWDASTDNVGVDHYTVRIDGGSSSSTTSLSHTASGFACGTSHSISVVAVDAAANASTPGSVTASTDACPDNPPSAPPSFTASDITNDGATFDWGASTDDHGVVAYILEVGSSRETLGLDDRPFRTVYLDCGTQYTATLTAKDTAGQLSTPSRATFTTLACPPETDTLAPTADTGDAGLSSTGSGVTLPATGTAPTLYVDGDQGDPARDVFVKYSVPTGVTAATLTFWTTSSSSSQNITIATASNSWTESSTTLPLIGSAVATKTGTCSGTTSTPCQNTVTIPTSALPAGDVTLVLSRTATSRVDVLSRESAHPPTLTVTS